MYNVKQFCSRRKIVFVALMLGLFYFLLKLGFWQLQRAHEKSFIIANSNQQRLYKLWYSEMPLPDAYEKIHIKGNFLKTIFYLDNQWQQHNLGYDVVLPFVVSKNTVVMVDIGWIPRHTVSKLPDVIIPAVHEIQGYAYFDYTKQRVLGEIVESRTQNSIVIEKIDLKVIADIINKNVYPFILRLDAKSPFGFVKTWPIVNMSPERHKAYALQWFGLAIVVAIGTMFIILRKAN